MAKINANLTQKDKKYREFALNGNLWKVVIQQGIPLALYQSFVMIFNILDNIMAAHISSGAVSATAFIHQIIMAISAIGVGLSVGGGMKISEAYGKGDYLLVKKRVSSICALCGIGGILLLSIIIPFSRFFLSLAGTPENLINIGDGYFKVTIIATVLSFFNIVYISIERARGNVRRILYINILVSIIKLTLTGVFVYLLNGDVTSIAAATLISQIVFLIFAIMNMRGTDNAFTFSIKAVEFKTESCGILVLKSIPVTIEKVVFSLGKIIVNNMAVIYGDTTVGALGISNNISGLGSNLENGFQDAGTAIISQNLGAGNKKRAFQAFKKIFIINISIGLIFLFLTLWQLDLLSYLFAKNDEGFRLLIMEIYSYEAFAAVALGINSAVMALIYGFGLTKLSLFLNFSRVFLFRIPVLWFLQNFTNMGAKSVGAVMLISNIAVAAVGIITAFIISAKIKIGEI